MLLIYLVMDGCQENLSVLLWDAYMLQWQWSNPALLFLLSFSVRQFLGVAFLAIGLWAWSEKVSLLLLSLCRGYRFWTRARNPQTKQIICIHPLLLTSICLHKMVAAVALLNQKGMSCSPEGRPLNKGQKKGSDAFHRFIHCDVSAGDVFALLFNPNDLFCLANGPKPQKYLL